MTTAQVLREARSLISDPRRWTTGVFARFGNNHPADPFDERATCFCAMGALIRARGADSADSEVLWANDGAFRLLRRAAGDRWPAEVNDSDGHEAVLRMYDRAIALAEAAGDNASRARAWRTSSS